MKRAKSLLFTLSILACSVLVAICIAQNLGLTSFLSESQKKDRIISFLEKNPKSTAKFYDLVRTFDLIKSSYVDPKSTDELLDLAMKGTVEGLDPNSHLFIGDQASTFLKFIINERKYSGIGISIMTTGKYTVVTKVFDNSPAQKAGLEPGDFILRVNGKNTWGLNVKQVVNMIREPENSDVSIEIRNTRLQKPKILTMKKQKVTEFSVTYKTLPNKIEYIKVNSFVKETGSRFYQALKDSEDKKGLIIDLRDNFGGMVNSAGEMLGYMLGKDVYIILFKERNIFQKIYTKNKKVKYPKKVVVLVNNYSASASEIMSGNLQLYKIATIVGVRTYGKATKQSSIDIDSNPHSREKTKLMIVLTTARYYLSDNRDISKDGITPDVEIEQPEGFKAYQYNTDKDLQFQKALELLK